MLNGMRPSIAVIAIGLSIAGAMPACHAADATPRPGAEPAIDTEAIAVLQRHCARCHANGKEEGDLGFVTDAARLVAEGYVVPGAAARSELVRRIAEGEMPPPSVKRRPTKRELAIVRAWVDSMASPERPFQTWSELDKILAADAARLPYAARSHARWFSIAHLSNAGATDLELGRVRTALAKLLASLTWSAKSPALVAVDTRRTVFRIDLRELGWSDATWDAIRAAYPYGVARGGVPEAIRADWFVATASRAPLYHAILGLPDTLDKLAARLGIDLAEDVHHDDVARAGFNRSGVSVNNRVLERHATRFGALWRSYDFATSRGRDNVFAHPLDLIPAGGEVIFNLPDGMQAYMLVDRDGHRIDRAPTTIVSDPRRPDRAVENAVSCMGCHAAGILDHADQVRATASVARIRDRDRIRTLYPPASEMSAYYARDRARFVAALRTMGSLASDAEPPAPADEPIALTTIRYEDELDLATAAAELGLRGSELAARIPRATSLRNTLDALSRSGGTIKRDVWIAAFPRILGELGLGVPFTPRTHRDVSPPVWVDAAGHTWIAVDRAGRDHATARGICRGRGYELPRTAELTRALSAGMGAGLSLVRPVWAAEVRLDPSNLRYARVVDPRTGAARRADVTDRAAIVCLQH